MGIQTQVRKFILKTFSACHTVTPPKINTELVTICMMQYLRATIPDTIVTGNDLVNHFVKKITGHFTSRNGCMVVVANFDLASPGVKKFVTHVKRHDIRCKKCKSTPNLKLCEKCESKTSFKFKDGPYIKNHMDTPLPFTYDEYSRFSSDTRNLRCELYPLIVNALIQYAPPKQFQKMIINGLPFKTVSITHEDFLWETGYNASRDDSRERVVPWEMREIPLPHIIEKEYHKVFEIEAMPPNIRQPGGWIRVSENVEYQNDIHEADNAVFFFPNFFPQYNRLISINDGDAIPIGLLRVAEDYSGSSQIPTTILRLKNGTPTDPQPYDYINLTQLYTEITTWSRMVDAGVQSPVATFVFLIIISNTDFFKNFCSGIGTMTKWKSDPEKRKKQKMGVWDTFFDNITLYSHMVQYYINSEKRDLGMKRRIVIDEVLFKMFYYKCYINRYMAKTKNVGVTAIRVRCSKLSERNRIPSDEVIDVKCRNITWNLQYWLNAFRNIYINPFKKINGSSYYGFLEDRISDNVYPIQEKVDEAYRRHFYKDINAEKRIISPLKRAKVAKEMSKIVDSLF